jgi:glycosyltransferase involved in cell wall biosynthesis
VSQIEAYPQARPGPALRRHRAAVGLGPQVAIVVPVYRHSALLVDAVSAALQQETSFEFCVILVNDGCPFEETHQACLEFLLGSSGRVFYLRRPNGGLSAARNTGIDFAVNTWLSVKAIYFLDADNIILPGSLQRAFDALEEDPGIGWIYPNIDMFGQEWTADFAGEYSVLQHLEHNICEAGSLVSRAVFDAGVRFDETMRLGFEDWDFWLSAVELGFRGKFLRDFGFRYRKRPESMVRDSERDRSEIQAYLRRKHAALWTQKNLLALEHAEAPRYGIYLFDTAEVQRTSDPALRGAVTSIDGFEEMYFRGKIAPSRYHRPYFLVFTATTTVAALRRVGLLHWVLWRSEQLTSSNSFVYLTLDNNADDRIEIEIQEKDAEAYDHRRAHLLVTTTKLVDECLDDPLDSWIMSLRENNPQPKICCLRVSLPQTDAVSSEPAVNARFLDFVRHMRKASRDQYCATHAGSWRAPGFEPRALLFRVSRQLLGGGPVFPRVRAKDSPDIGFLVSVAEFGGVEKVAYSVAEIFKSHGWTPHLFVFGRQRCGLAHRLTKIFSTISFFNEPGIGDWNEHHRFLGSHYTNWGRAGRNKAG